MTYNTTHVQLEDGDADVALVKKALRISANNHVRVISDDSDVLILQIHYTRQPSHCKYLQQSGHDIDIIGLRNSLGKSVETLLLCDALILS